MPAKSKSQQKLFGMVHAAQKGELKNPSPEVSKIAKSISAKDAEDFASTKHKGLPERKEKKKDKKKNEHSLWQIWKEQKLSEVCHCGCGCKCKNCENHNCDACKTCPCKCRKEE